MRDKDPGEEIGVVVGKGAMNDVVPDSVSSARAAVHSSRNSKYRGDLSKKKRSYESQQYLARSKKRTSAVGYILNTHLINQRHRRVS